MPYKERREALAVIEEFRNVFTDLSGLTDLAVHRIQITSDHSVKSKPYLIPFHIKSKLENDNRDMLKINIIRALESPCASPAVLVLKLDKTNWLCGYYRKLNRLTICDPESMTLLVDAVQDLALDRYFTKIDLLKATGSSPWRQKIYAKPRLWYTSVPINSSECRSNCSTKQLLW